MIREKLIVDSQLLWDQIEAIAQALAPLYEGLGTHVPGGGVVNADETPWKMLSNRGNKR